MVLQPPPRHPGWIRTPPGRPDDAPDDTPALVGDPRDVGVRVAYVVHAGGRGRDLSRNVLIVLATPGTPGPCPSWYRRSEDAFTQTESVCVPDILKFQTGEPTRSMT